MGSARLFCAAAAAGLFGLLTFSAPAGAASMGVSYTGVFGADDDTEAFGFTLDSPLTVTLKTYGYAGGTQADGNIVSAGGFDAILALFDSTGLLIGQNDDGFTGLGSCAVPEDLSTYGSFDSCLVRSLSAGSYTAVIAQYDNSAIGPHLSDGFARTGNPTFTAILGMCGNGQFCDVRGENRTNAWAFDVVGVAQVENPEPSTALLLGSGLVALALRRRTGSLAVSTRDYQVSSTKVCSSSGGRT